MALPPALAALIDDCVATDPSRRPATGAELHQRLRAVAEAEWGTALEQLARFLWLRDAESTRPSPAQ